MSITEMNCASCVLLLFDALIQSPQSYCSKQLRNRIVIGCSRTVSIIIENGPALGEEATPGVRAVLGRAIPWLYLLLGADCRRRSMRSMASCRIYVLFVSVL